MLATACILVQAWIIHWYSQDSVLVYLPPPINGILIGSAIFERHTDAQTDHATSRQLWQ